MSSPRLTSVYGLSPQVVSKALLLHLSSARLHSYIRPVLGFPPWPFCSSRSGGQAFNRSLNHHCYRPCSAAGLACFDSAAVHHNHKKPSRLPDHPRRQAGFALCQLPLKRRSWHHRPADPHQFVSQGRLLVLSQAPHGGARPSVTRVMPLQL